MADEQPARGRSPPDWKSGLPSELLQKIGGHLFAGDDAAAFRSVCSPWRAAVPFASFAPRLVLPLGLGSGSFAVYSVTDGRKKTTTLELPAARGKALCGSSQGWLALADESAAVTLLNPFTGASVELPPADERVAKASSWSARLSRGAAPAAAGGDPWLIHRGGGGGYDDLEEEAAAPTAVELHELRTVFFHEVVLSAPPDAEGGECVAMAVLPCSTEVALCRVGADAAWTLVDTNLDCCVDAVVFCQGRFVAVDCVGEVSVFSPVVAGAAPTATPVPSLSPPAEEMSRRSYLESDGELHLVGAMVSDVCHVKLQISYSIEVYRCNVLDGAPAWSRVHDAGDRTLLVSKQFRSSCFSGPGVSEYSSNSVYFSEPLYGDQGDLHHRLEIVDIADGTSELEEPFAEKMRGSSEALFWIRPSMWKRGGPSKSKKEEEQNEAGPSRIGGPSEAAGEVKLM
ncbi:hypothetical protein ACP4OV_025584 [Aristida adscensionis]